MKLKTKEMKRSLLVLWNVLISEIWVCL